MKTPQRDPREGVYRIEGPVSSSVDGTFAGGFHAVFYGVPADPLATNRALYYQIDYNGSLPRRGTSFEATMRTAVGNQATTTDRVSVVQLSGP